MASRTPEGCQLVIASAMSHNLLGQRLGRKGLETRQRILAAALRQLDGRAGGTPVTLTSIAREASIGITTLYLYFPDLGDLVLAALRSVMESAKEAFLGRLRSRWPDDGLQERCLDFLQAHYGFWNRHSRILHLRNSFADAGDVRFVQYRHSVSRPLIELLVEQMVVGTAPRSSELVLLATLLLTGCERIATVVTGSTFHDNVIGEGGDDQEAYIDRLLRSEAKLIALAIRSERSAFTRPT
jgi:AcrR family transcriptional regulator